jgi:hypothetical protein
VNLGTDIGQVTNEFLCVVVDDLHVARKIYSLQSSTLIHVHFVNRQVQASGDCHLSHFCSSSTFFMILLRKLYSTMWNNGENFKALRSKFSPLYWKNLNDPTHAYPVPADTHDLALY